MKFNRGDKIVVVSGPQKGLEGEVAYYVGKEAVMLAQAERDEGVYVVGLLEEGKVLEYTFYEDQIALIEG